MTDKSTSYISASSGTPGMVWFAGWLFTIGYLELGIWKGALALVAWPYFLGVTMR